MKKQILLVTASAVIIIIVSLGFYFRSGFVTNKNSVKKLIEENKGIKQLEKNNKYIDPAGFSFDYPNNAKVEVVKSSNKTAFSSLKIASEKINGGLTLNVEPNNIADLETWLKKQKNLGPVEKIKLADLDAVKISKKTGQQIVAIDVGSIFTIDTDFATNKEYWVNATNIFVKSFAFSPPPADNLETGQGTSDYGGDDVVLEGEEVVE